MDRNSQPLVELVQMTLKTKRLLYGAGAVGCLLAAVPVLWITWWVILFVVAFGGDSFGLPSVALYPLTWLVFALLFVGYATANWERLERLEFESPAHLRMTRGIAFLADSPFLALAGPKTAGSFVKVISVSLLLGPGLLHTAWKLGRRIQATWSASAESVARVLAELARANAKIPLEDLTPLNGDGDPAGTLSATLWIDGVLLRSSEPVSLAMTDALREEVQRVGRGSRRGEVRGPAGR